MNIEKLYDELEKTIKVATLKPELLQGMNNVSYDRHVSYFQGLFFGIKVTTKYDIERILSFWYQDRVCFKAPNMNWFAQFEQINMELSESDKKNLILATLKSFVEDHRSSN